VFYVFEFLEKTPEKDFTFK